MDFIAQQQRGSLLRSNTVLYSVDMFDLTLFLLLIIISLPGLLVTIPQQRDRMKSLVKEQASSSGKPPSARTLIIISFIQNLVLVAIAAAVGTALAHQVGFTTPIYTSIKTGAPPFGEAVAGLLPTVLISAAAMIPFLLVYYGLVRPRLDLDTTLKVEGLRMDLGIPARVLYGGIVEEILFRWGLMTLLVWAGAALLGDESPALVWAALILSGVLFGVGHLPGLTAAGAKMTNTLRVSTILLNLYAGILFGWIYWQYGLGAAILSHITFHLVWLPFDLRAYKKLLEKS